MNPEKCDHCHRTKYPTLFTFKFFGRVWRLCPACCRLLGVLMKHKAATIVTPLPKRQIIPPATPGGLAGLIAVRAAEARRSASV